MVRRALLTLWTIVAACAVVTAQGTAARPAQTPTPTPTPPAGQQDPQQPPVFRTRIDSVGVDVTVTDKQGKLVTDLRSEDFEIRESGKLQTIDSFRFIQTEVTEARGVEAPRQILSEQDQKRETANPQNRIFLIFLDDYHTRESNGLFIRKELAKWVQGLTSHDLVALLYPWQPAVAATFSVDHDGTAAAIMKFRGRKYDYRAINADEDRYAHYPPETQEQIRNDATIRTLQSACSLMATLRDGRKTLLYVSEGMFATLPAGVRVNSNFSPPITPGTNAKSGAENSYEYFRSSDLLLHMQDIFRVATRGNTAIYTLDPRGLATSEFNAGDNVGIDADRAVLTESIDNLRVIADQTGGRAIVGGNAPLPDLQKMVEEASAYYLLGYTSTLAPRDGKFHEIQVKVNRKDLVVSARKGYWAYTEEETRKASEPPKAGPPAEIAHALELLADNVEPTSRHDVVLWLGAARGETERAQVTLAWETPPGILSSGTDRIEQVSVVATVGAETVFKGDVPRDPTALRPAGKISFSAPAGSIRVRVTPQNSRGQKLDTTDLIDSVPDFSTPGPTLTAPQVFRGRTPFEIGTIRKAASPQPVATRLFSRAERLLVRFDAYSPLPPQVSLRLLSREGKLLADLPAPTLLSGTTFEAEINLIVCSTDGDFILEFTATTGADKTVKLLAIRVKS